jgi:hypothetical protein
MVWERYGERGQQDVHIYRGQHSSTHPMLERTETNAM